MPQCDINTLFLSKKHLDIVQELLKKHVPTADVWVYGSRITGHAHEGSDLDLVLRNPNDVSLMVQGYDDLIGAIQKSMLPMLVDVHVWSHLPQAFYANILEHYAVLQTGTRA
jgi:uncharacterized protein